MLAIVAQQKQRRSRVCDLAAAFLLCNCSPILMCSDNQMRNAQNDDMVPSLLLYRQMESSMHYSCLETDGKLGVSESRAVIRVSIFWTLL